LHPVNNPIEDADNTVAIIATLCRVLRDVIGSNLDGIPNAQWKIYTCVYYAYASRNDSKNVSSQADFAS
jgi:hypothetical protein